MPKIERLKRRHLLKKRDRKAHIEQIERDLGTSVTGLDEKAKLEEGLLDDGTTVLILEGSIIFFELDGRMVPTLHAILDGLIQIPSITVDMGAVKFVVNGADIMRPGVTKIDDGIMEGSIVAIVDERHGKALAVGVSKMSSDEMRAATHGKVAFSKHYVNDALWEFGKS
ncbi:MAG: PUA domain-containing protein [Promethearchaeota archaeon]